MPFSEDRQAARALVQQISRDHGYLDEEQLQKIEPEYRGMVEQALLNKDRMIGSAVITLAKNLYTSQARFILELLQNADDNNYTKAAASNSLPQVSFNVYPRQIVFECNEDGFTPDNLKAICSVGTSSKAGAHGYIGEKGIGFKSVFMAAWKAHIQSGPFSFSFVHRRGDSGMGMISPVWESTAEEVEAPLTRFTLHLHERDDEDLLTRTQSIAEQFEDLQETLLLFMKNLKRIHINFYEVEGGVTPRRSVSYSIERPRANYAVLKCATTHAGTTREHIKYFHVTTHQATNLARSENRTYSEAEETTQVYSDSQVTLAFPLSEADVPIIQSQDLFVFLPVRAVGFNFIIQADFVTEASRQDIVEDSPRNKGLLDGIADAFIKAISQFCHHDTLRYQWARYLPARTGGNVTTFWKALIEKIAHRVSNRLVLYCHKKNDLHYIRDLVRLQDYLYEDGRPLFDDGSTEQIISQRYDVADLAILHDYGLRWARTSEFLEWLRQDLIRGASGRWKSSLTTDSWHTQAANVLYAHALVVQGGPFPTILRRMDLLPLADGTWGSIASAPVYFAHVDGLDIPSDLDLRIIAKNVTNQARLRLFKKLGTTTASVALVRQKILERYRDDSLTWMYLETSKSHLQFLYLTQDLKNEQEPSYDRLSIQVQDAICVRPHRSRTYIADVNDPYGPWELFRVTAPGPFPGDGARGYPVHFAKAEYFSSGPESPMHQGLTWVRWFHDHLHLPDYVVFEVENPMTWGGAAEYLRNNRPEKFLGALRLHHQHNPHPSEDFIQCVQHTDVLCRGNRLVPLQEAYFPTQSIERLVGRYVEPDAFFPWLWLDIGITQDWMGMMKAYDVGFAEDVVLALHMLEYSLDALPTDTNITSSSRDRLFRLYNHIQAKYWEAEDRPAAKDRIRNVFTERTCVFIPSTGDEPNWAGPENCVWDAPEEMKTKFVLRLLYQQFFAAESADFLYLHNFFTETLGIGNCTWQNYIDELSELRDADCGNMTTITNIYRELEALGSGLSTDSDREAFRSAFDDDDLIFLPSNDGPSWHKTSRCVWSTAASLRGRVSLNHEYAELYDFFVGFLGVRPVDLSMAIEELKEVGSRESGIIVQEVKDSIFTVNSLLIAEPAQPCPRNLLGKRIFPIRYPSGHIECHSKETTFFVVDREPLRRSFEGEVKFIDFTLEEVNRLQPFLYWTHLEDRYLSANVKEITSFHGSGGRILSNQNRDIRPRAHAILRLAFHFNSPRTVSHQGRTELYTTLRNAKVYETDGISSDLHLAQDGESHIVAGDVIALHFGGDETNLKIYVPADQAAQHYTFTSTLPAKLLQWLMTNPASQIEESTSDKGVVAVAAILNGPLSLLSKGLEDQGIIGVDIADRNERVEQGSTSSESSTDVTSASEDGPRASISLHDQGNIELTPEAIDTPASSVETIQQDNASGLARNSVFRLPIHPRTSRNSLGSPFQSSILSQSTPPDRLFIDSSFTDLLTEVIAAGRRDTIPYYADLAVDYLQEVPFGRGRDYEIHGESRFERDCKLGAVGELYVFELLLHLTPELPGFSINNWQSTMREYITVHPEYATMGSWEGRETSDITYEDVEGVLTQYLIGRNYLDRETWSGKRPYYFIEVKTTKQSCDTPFYMSNAQFERMRDNVLEVDNTDTIYMIFRVYNLGRADQPLGLKVYLDPETLRLANQLEFTARSWSVVPGDPEY